MEKIITIPEIPAKYDLNGNMTHAAIPETVIYNYGPNTMDDDFLKSNIFKVNDKKE
jgi:hypothetical protein